MNTLSFSSVVHHCDHPDYVEKGPPEVLITWNFLQIQISNGDMKRPGAQSADNMYVVLDIY